MSHPSCRRGRWWCGLGLAAVLLAGCAGSRSAERPPERRFGHRPEAPEAGGRATMTLSVPDSAVGYFYYPALYDSVYARPGPFDPSRPAEVQRVPVEVLVKGALPDACTALHAVSQERTEHLVEVELTVRRPQGAVCTRVVRPYRYYLMLEGTYAPGSYTLKVNGRVWPFVVEVPEES